MAILAAPVLMGMLVFQPVHTQRSIHQSASVDNIASLRTAAESAALDFLAGPVAERVRRAAAVRRAQGGQRNWIQRHPAIFGSLVGFTAGFLIGFLPGDDAVFDDFTAVFNGSVLGDSGPPRVRPSGGRSAATERSTAFGRPSA